MSNGKFDVEALERNWKWSDGDPEELFVLEEEIASGSFGSVYKARHIEDDNIYALKIIQPEEDDDVSEFIELHILQRCHHPNIVGLLGTWKKGDEIFIAQDYCGGGAISDMPQVWDLELKEEQIALICREVLRGLKYLHDNCIIHRDIKGANILLTEGGDVKLIDFGVSAVLAARDEKRNTLIGTPYWMAPEIISNKNGKNPYDERIDLWSLGITCIELAEKEPPLSEVHPMRALMQIPIRDAPTLQNTKKWSREFVDFVKECLMKDQKKRHTAEEMLLHPFVANLGEDKKCLIQLLEDARKAKARVAAEEESSMDEPNKADGGAGADEEDPDDTASPAPLPPSLNGTVASPIPAPLGGSPGPGASDTKPRGHSDAAALPVVDRSASERSMSVSAAPSNGAQSSSTPSKKRQTSETSTPLPQKRAPTVRATLKQPSVTRREMEIKQAKIMNKALIMQQLKELAAQRAIHMKELERLRKKHKQEADALEAEYKSVSTRLRETTASRDKAISERQTSETESMQRRHRREVTELQGNAQKEEKKVVRELESRQKVALTEFKEGQKATRKEAEKEHKEAKKLKKAEQKSLGKKEKTQAEADLKAESAAFKLNIDQLEEQGLRKTGYVQARERFVALADTTTTSMHESHTKVLDQLWEMSDLKEKHLLERQDSAKTFDNESHEMEQAFMKRRIVLQVGHLEKEHALIKQQLEKEQAVEKAQQSKLLKSDQRAALKEWAKGKAQRHKDFLKTSKETMKGKMTLKKEERAAFQTSLNDDFNAKQKALDQEFNAKQLKEMTDEETLLSQHHSSQLEALAVDQRAEVETMTAEHVKISASLEERIRITNAHHARNHWQERWNLLKERQKSVMELRKTQHGEQRTLHATQSTDLLALLASQLAELLQLMQQQQRSDTEIQRMQSDFAADKAEIETKQSAAEAALMDAIRKNVVQIKADHKAARKALAAQAPPGHDDALLSSASGANAASSSESEPTQAGNGDSSAPFSVAAAAVASSSSSNSRRNSVAAGASSSHAGLPAASIPSTHHESSEESKDSSDAEDGAANSGSDSDDSPSRRRRKSTNGHNNGTDEEPAPLSTGRPGSILGIPPSAFKGEAIKGEKEKAGRRGSSKRGTLTPSPLPPPLDGSIGSLGGSSSDATASSPRHNRKGSDHNTPGSSKKRHTRHTSSQSPLPNAIDTPLSGSSPEASSKRKKKSRSKTESTSSSPVPPRSASPAPVDSDSE